MEGKGSEKPEVALAQLASKNEWSVIEDMITVPSELIIRDEKSEKFVLDVQSRVNKLDQVSTVTGTFACFHFLLWSSSTRQDDVGLLTKMLAVGADANLASGGVVGWRPAHYCAAKGWVKCLEALCNVGLNVDAESARAGETAFVVAARNKREDALEILRAYRKSGYKPLAQLAEDKVWYAVLNRLRRRCLLFGDFVRKHNGKTALEWCRFHRSEIGDELAYWMRKFLPECQHAVPLPIAAPSHQEVISDLKRLVEKQQDVLNDVVSRLIGLEAKFRALDAQTSRLSPSPKPTRHSLLLGLADCSEPVVPSGEAFVALEDKLSMMGALVAERDAELCAKISALQERMESVLSKKCSD